MCGAEIEAERMRFTVLSQAVQGVRCAVMKQGPVHAPHGAETEAHGMQPSALK